MDLISKLRMRHKIHRYKQRHEKESVKFVLAQQLKGKVALDIGANMGIYTYYLSKLVGQSGKVYAFDAQPELIPHLKDLSKSFHLNNVTAVGMGLSDQHSQLSMIRSKIGSGGARIVNNSDQKVNDVEEITVKVMPLDDYVKSEIKGNIGFIKIDVEGHEMRVLNGARTTLSTHRPIVMAECTHEEAKEGSIFRLFEELDYQSYFFDGAERYAASDFKKVPYPRSDQHRNYMFEPR